jgi:hypothetical protein
MADPLTVDSDLPDARSLVKFRNFGRCFVLTEAKAKSDAINFRETATLLNSSDRAKAVAIWLNALADKYDQGEL